MRLVQAGCSFPEFLKFSSIYCVWFCLKAVFSHEPVHFGIDFNLNEIREGWLFKIKAVFYLLVYRVFFIYLEKNSKHV